MTKQTPHSSHWGAFTAVTHRGELVGAQPHRSDPDPSALLESISDAVNSDLRVHGPAIRRSWLEGGPGHATERRGADEFVEVGWNEALDRVAGELDRVRQIHGNQAIFGGSYGWASAGRFHHAKTQLQRFLNRIGGFTTQRHNYSFATALSLLPHVVGSAAVVSGDVTTWGCLKSKTSLWIAFGGLPPRTSQVESGGISWHQVQGALREVAATGTRFVNVSPLRTDMADELQADWWPVRPNGDTALMLALAYCLESDGTVDRDFLARYTSGYEKFRQYLLGISDGIPKSPEWAAGKCEIASERIRALARRMACVRTFITVTWSLQRAEHGEQPYWMAITLAAMLGQIGLEGGGFSFGFGNQAAIGATKWAFGAPALPAGPVALDSWIPVARHVEMLEKPGQVYEFNGQVRTYPDIRLIYWAGGNPFHHHQDTNRLIHAWRRPDSIIVHEPWWTPTARHADIVLPATTTLERNDIGASSRDRALIAMKRAIEPVGKARNDFDIFSALAVRLGVESEFTEGRDEQAWIEFLYASTQDRARSFGVDLPAFCDFWSAGEVQIPHEGDRSLMQEFRADPLAHPLKTPSGRIEIYSETIAGFGYDDCPGHPCWLEPVEWLGSTQAENTPLHLISNQPATRLHSQLDMGRVSLRSKVNGREPIQIHPKDAARRAIEDGQLVVVFNDRGRCLAGAVLTDAVREGVVVLSTGAWYDPLEPGTPGTLELHGNPNVLTRDVGTSRLGQGPSAHSALVEVRPFSGDAKAVAAHTPPTMSRRAKDTHE